MVMPEILLSAAAFLFSVVTLVFSFRAWQLGDRRARIPVLVFVFERDQRWVLRNIGNGPALNVTVAWRDSHEPSPWLDPTRVPPIPRDGQVALSWLVKGMNIQVLGATYQDFLGADSSRPGRTYTATCAYALSSVRPGRHLPNWTTEETQPQWIRERLARAVSQPSEADQR
jgi:hypothetical protein